MTQTSPDPVTAAEAFLARLGAHGVDYLFGNAGTDFPSIIEGFCRARETNQPVPTPIAVPHENLAVAMAHGYYHATGRPQAVMLHVNVGTANAICGLFNASRDKVPVLLFAGRTPITEDDSIGARNVFIHWGQEMFDQGGMVRETVKWDYELRTADQVTQVVDRAMAIALSEPRGPTYVTLPREILAKETSKSPAELSAVARPAPPAPDAAALEQLADWVTDAAYPVIICGGYGQRAGDAETLAHLADSHALPVIAYRPRHSPIPSDHPWHMGFEVGAHVKSADLIIVLDSDAPWLPKLHTPNPDARIVHIGADPLLSDYVMRNFPSHLGITGQSSLVLAGLDAALSERDPSPYAAARREVVDAAQADLREMGAKAVEAASVKSLSTTPWIAHCLNAAKGPDDLVVTEMVFPMHLMDFPNPGCHFGLSPAGGLGWGLGESIGLKLANPDRRVIAVVGDGSYMFGNPTPAHFVCEALGLPILTIIVNNAMWGAVRRATLSMYPNGAASRSNDAPLTHLKPSPRFEHVVEASGGFSECVKNAADLPAALERALHAVDVEKRQAVLNVICEYADGAAAADAKR